MIALQNEKDIKKELIWRNKEKKWLLKNNSDQVQKQQDVITLQVWHWLQSNTMWQNIIVKEVIEDMTQQH